MKARISQCKILQNLWRIFTCLAYLQHFNVTHTKQKQNKKTRTTPARTAQTQRWEVYMHRHGDTVALSGRVLSHWSVSRHATTGRSASLHTSVSGCGKCGLEKRAKPRLCCSDPLPAAAGQELKGICDCIVWLTWLTAGPVTVTCTLGMPIVWPGRDCSSGNMSDLFMVIRTACWWSGFKGFASWNDCFACCSIGRLWTGVCKRCMGANTGRSWPGATARLWVRVSGGGTAKCGWGLPTTLVWFLWSLWERSPCSTSFFAVPSSWMQVWTRSFWRQCSSSAIPSCRCCWECFSHSCWEQLSFTLASSFWDCTCFACPGRFALRLSPLKSNCLCTGGECDTARAPGNVKPEFVVMETSVLAEQEDTTSTPFSFSDKCRPDELGFDSSAVVSSSPVRDFSLRSRSSM